MPSCALSDDFKELVRTRTDIVQLVGERACAAIAARRTRVRRTVPLSRRPSAVADRESRTPIVQVLGLQRRGRLLHLRAEDRER